MTGNSVLDVFVIIGIIGTAIAVLWKGTLFVMGIYRRVQNFLDDWNGELARPGVPGRKGISERLETIESELTTNHGSSLKDAVKRIETGLDDLHTSFTDHVKQQADSGRIPGLIDESN